MTSKSDNLKTNEFLRLRKLRLQQVREQSKDIAKKIRQRAKVEQLRHVTNVDSNKEREYLRQQAKLVNRLEQLYSKGIQNVGAGHKNACEVNEKEISKKEDLSKLRGKEAVAVLKKKKQEKLDEQKKILDRKLQAREVANVLSREKFNVVANNLMKSSSSKSVFEIPVKDTLNEEKVTSESKESLTHKPDSVTKKNDMGTQWEFEGIPTEWEPHVPSLPIPNDDSIKNSADDKVEKSEKSKRLNLFALSDEMPSSLRGSTTKIPDDIIPLKPSLTLVSEYLQNRGLRLREPDSTHLQKKSSDDLQSIKQTLLRTRASRTDVSAKSNNIDRFSKSDDTNRGLRTKNSVTMYDHNTRDTRDMPHNVDKFVIRDQNVDDDAYSQALKESSVAPNDDKPHHVIQQEARNKLAMTRQNVDKEYRDTLAFLSNLPKDKPAGSIKTAYMDGDRQQDIKDRRQQKLQHAYKKIEKQCSKHHCKNARNRTVSHEQNRSKSISPARTDIDNNLVNRDFQYSWLPVPESDGNMAIHTISNTMNDNKHNKLGNTVKFSSVDTYHEYRSRHKHTPPTKDVDTEPSKRLVEAVIIQEDNATLESSSDTDTSSVENLRVNLDDIAGTKTDKDKQITDAERIIIYKVMESKNIKKHKTKKKRQCRNNVDKSHSSVKKQTVIGQPDYPHTTNADEMNKANTVSFTQLKEGVYKSVSADGDNITSLYFSDDQREDKRSAQTKNTVIDNEHDHGAKTVTEGNHFKRKSKPCENCKNTGSHQLPDQHPSAATSTSSFKTAVNDKINNVLLDGGYVKFVDEGGQDTGKFYVGASGFLKDDAYEVIIQLRKKEAERSNKMISKDDKTIKTRTLPQKINEEDELKEQSEVIQSNNRGINLPAKNLVPDEKPEDAPIEQSDLLSSLNTNIIPQQISIINEKVPTPTEVNVDNSKQDNATIEPPQFIEKGVSTTFHDSFAIPDKMAKLPTTPRPVTSTYTQTTQNSPNPRPVLMHLSSSTSTTYMSPPDIVLPRYLRHGGSDTCDFTYEPISSNIDSQNIRSANCKVNRCTKCKKRDSKSKADTPPNSTRSTNHTKDKIVNDKQFYNIKNEVRHIKQHKCKYSIESEICCKQKCKRSSSENRRLHSGSNYTIPMNKKRKVPNSIGRVNLNPAVENYIKQLLTLNKEGLKAIEVVNQECSAVNTPGSSIIDVPNNKYKNKTMVCNQISLQQIKNTIKNQILKDIGNTNNTSKGTVKTTGSQTDKMIKFLFKSNRKRPVHKVKSFNISKQFAKPNKETRQNSARSTAITTPRSLNSKVDKKNQISNIDKKNTTTPRRAGPNQDSSNNTSYSEPNKACVKPSHSREIKASKTVTKVKTDRHYIPKTDLCRQPESYTLPSHKATTTSHSSESEVSNPIRSRRNLSTPPISISTQTNQIDSEAEFMKLAENKLQNMEKIADLTEKCTKRLSNLAKVLEEVRRNKSLVYSQISTSECTSDSEQRSDIKMQANNNSLKTFNPTVETQTSTEVSVPTTTSPYVSKIHDVANISDYAPILTGLPKPDHFKTSSATMVSVEGNKADVSTAIEQGFKSRGKPPPALTRINLKHAPEGFVIPHELSTVLEVDSPMSLKLKSYTTQIDNKNADTDTEGVDGVNQNDIDDKRIASDVHKKSIDLSSLGTKFNMSKKRHKVQYTDSSEDSKIKMMDLKHFNDIMLKPFITVQEYAKQYKIDELDGRYNFNGVLRNENPNEELSSLHSEGSIPDVMAELLKRNLISEPFKFETTSNANSTTLSSESTLSLLALSRAQKDKQKSTILVKNKENNGETSASLSISSNPDLEHAFQRLGMGWASSTLKKTKERLALSSSSNTSSSSLPQLKIKSFHYQEVPELSSLLNLSNKEERKQGNSIETPKNAVQQTSLTNSMTVKEFLANELAKKITFSNQTNRNTTENEFISLYETKMPEEIKQMSQNVKENEKSADSVPNASNARARTSTPVQIYKSMTYHSTSSSNTSNGLFSNADDLSSVKGTSNSIKNHSTSDKDDLTSLTIPNYSFKIKKGISECTKSD